MTSCLSIRLLLKLTRRDYADANLDTNKERPDQCSDRFSPRLGYSLGRRRPGAWLQCYFGFLLPRMQAGLLGFQIHLRALLQLLEYQFFGQRHFFGFIFTTLFWSRCLLASGNGIHPTHGIVGQCLAPH